MPLVVSQMLLDTIRKHGEGTYPSECCGFLVGDSDGDVVKVHDVVAASNDFPEDDVPGVPPEEDTPVRLGIESQRNRYAIDPNELYHVEMQARARKLGVVGIYHSHPDAPARPSEYDRERACPWYCYVIVSVQNGKSDDMRNWILSDDGSGFVEDSIITRGD